MLTPDTALVRSNDVVANTLDNELVMMDVEQGTYFALDAIGADIWARLESPTRLSTLCAALVEAYDVDAATCLADVTALVEDLIAKSLVTVVAQ